MTKRFKIGDIIRCSDNHYAYELHKHKIFYVVVSDFKMNNLFFIDFILYEDIDKYLNNTDVRIYTDYLKNYELANNLIRKKKINKLLRCD